ncbi:Hypothetical protein SCF082_LOCUS33133 [Durusdinium trenchii]|uniref:Uncharacterized protein n=1 Tax=Durusdinium trenchii TaxID=1381693 RepID=A0ABP0NLG5_9DINO
MGMKPVVEASSESLGSKVARIAALVGGLAGVLTWRPSGSTGKAAQSLAVAAMVASLATSWRAGCDSKKRATGPIRDEYADPPYGLQDQVREDEPACSREDGSEEEPISEPSPEGSRDYAVDVSHGGEVEGSGTSGDSRELSLVSEEMDRGWDYDPAYWAQGPGGHDGTTLEDDVRDDWLAFMRDLTVDAGSPVENRPVESESSSAERPDWRRTLASEDEEPPTLDEMTAQGWRVVRSNLAPPNREIYRGPDPVLPPAEDQDGEMPTWMGNLCRSVTGPLRLVLRVPPDEVTGLHGALPACAEAKAVQAGSRAGEVMRRKLELLKSCWMCVTWFLYTHELLGKFARLSSAFAALLGDERCWQTLSLPKSPAMTQRLLKLMLVEEQELWAWPLCQVQQVDLEEGEARSPVNSCWSSQMPWPCLRSPVGLDFTDAKHSTLEQLRTLLMKKLDVEDNLQRLILRNIPISAKPSEASYSPWDQNLIRLVNPVHPKYPAGFCSSFLVTDELGALRQRFRGFRFFLRPVRRDGEVQRALEVTALRGLAGTPWTQRSTARHPSDLEIGAKADELVEFELGELKDLPPCHSVVTDRFEDWKERMATSYKRMLALI